MCECGCAMFDPDFQFPAPDGETFLLSIRPPCPECETPAGLILERVGAVQMRERLYSATRPPSAPFVAYASGQELALPIVAPRPLREQIAGEAGLDDSVIDADIATALGDAMRRTRQAWEATRQRKART
jgi:hypothetical protein